MIVISPDVLDKLLDFPYRTYLQDQFQVIDEHLGPENALKVERALDKFIAHLPQNLPDITKAALLYQILRRWIQYDFQESPVRYTYVAALFSGKAVCLGIAELYQVLAQKYGLECSVIIGYGTSDLHAWNLLRLGDEGSSGWYHLDLTWDLTKGIYRPARFFLKSDSYMQHHNHSWLQNKYPACPESITEKIRIPLKGVEIGCQILKKAIS